MCRPLLKTICFATAILTCMFAIKHIAPLALAKDVSADAKKQIAADKKLLGPLQVYVGGWKGSGMRKLGDADGWLAEADWGWDFAGGRAAIIFETIAGKWYKSGRLSPTDKTGTYTFVAIAPDGKTKEHFTGTLDKRNRLELFADKLTGKNRPDRIMISTVARGKRLLLQFSKKNGSAYTQLAQLGLTKKGSNFATSGVRNECVVTGGEGNRQVSYKGVTYYVCCKGCLQEFNDDPAGVIAEYKAKKLAAKNKKSS
jgi:YHS domain-containing protein